MSGSSAARDGLGKWRLQRLTAIALIPLDLYLASSILSLATSDRKTAGDWLSQPLPALLVILVVFAGITHALIGVRSVILDYVRSRARLLAAELFFRAIAVILAGAGVLAVLKLFLGR